MKRMFKASKAAICFVLIVGVMVFGFSHNTVYAIEDGAYIVNRTSSYNNPDTGLTARGETSNATGDNMAANILAGDVLVEISGGRTFVTIGLGMESTIRNVAIQVQNQAGGAFMIAPHTITGTSALNDDTCVHYRFEVVSPDLIISPRFIVDGMGIELEFYIVLDMNSRRPGTSVFLSEMVQAPVEVEADLPEQEPEEVEPEQELEQEAGEVEPEEEQELEEQEPEEQEPAEEEPTEYELAMEERRERLMVFMDPEANPLIGTKGLSTHVFMRSETAEEPVSTSPNLWLYITIGVISVGALVGGYLIYRKNRRSVS